MSQYNIQLLELARKLRQLTQKEVAAATGVSQAQISKAEHGLQRLCNEDLKKLAGYYNVPVNFFFQSESMTPAGHFYYRKRLAISDKVIDSFEAKVQILKSAIDKLMSDSDTPDYTIGSFSTAESSPSEIASKIRHLLKIYKGPVPKLTSLLENHGVIVFFFDFGTDKIDGLSSVTSSNRKVIFLNSRMPNDRIRFSLAHELGHLVMHSDFIPSSATEAEEQADEFASEFLMPSEEIKDGLHNLTFASLAQLKRYWQVSMKALLYKANKLGTITSTEYRNMQINFSKKGYTKSEPIPLPSNPPVIIPMVLELYKSELGYSDEEIRKTLCLSASDFSEWFGRRQQAVTISLQDYMLNTK